MPGGGPNIQNGSSSDSYITGKSTIRDNRHHIVITNSYHGVSGWDATWYIQRIVTRQRPSVHIVPIAPTIVAVECQNRAKGACRIVIARGKLPIDRGIEACCRVGDHIGGLIHICNNTCSPCRIIARVSGRHISVFRDIATRHHVALIVGIRLCNCCWAEGEPRTGCTPVIGERATHSGHVRMLGSHWPHRYRSIHARSFA